LKNFTLVLRDQRTIENKKLIEADNNLKKVKQKQLSVFQKKKFKVKKKKSLKKEKQKSIQCVLNKSIIIKYL
jgi:hypothetical protein